MQNNSGANLCAKSDAVELGAEKLSGICVSTKRAATMAVEPVREVPTDRTGPKKRSAKIILSNEGRVLKHLRLEHRLSMRRAAELIGVSTSTVAHIETGRMNAPTGARLERFLRVYGGIKTKSFYERVRTFRASPTPLTELQELLGRASDGQIRTVLAIVRGILG